MEIQITDPIINRIKSKALKQLTQGINILPTVKAVAKPATPKTINKPVAIPKATTSTTVNPAVKATPKLTPVPKITPNKATPKAITIPAIPTTATISVPQNLYQFVPYNSPGVYNNVPGVPAATTHPNVNPPKQPSEPPNKKQKPRVIDLVNE